MSTQLDITQAELDTLLAADTANDTPAATPKKYLSDFEKGKIAILYEQGWGYGRIGKHVGQFKATIQKFIKRYIERGTHQNSKAPGQPKKISKPTEAAILALIESDVSISKQKLIDSIPELHDIYSRTLDRMLRGKGIRKWIARKRPKLLPQHARARHGHLRGRIGP